MPHTIIGVMGPGEQASSATMSLAYELGQQIAQAGWVLLTGGRNAGVMAAASQGAQSAGGLTIGILPDQDMHQMSPNIDIPIITGMGHARNVINVLSSQVIIACGIGLGTTTEVAFALKTQTPVIFLGVEPQVHIWFEQLAHRAIPQTLLASEAMQQAQTILRLGSSGRFSTLAGDSTPF